MVVIWPPLAGEINFVESVGQRGGEDKENARTNLTCPPSVPCKGKMQGERIHKSSGIMTIRLIVMELGRFTGARLGRETVPGLGTHYLHWSMTIEDGSAPGKRTRVTHRSCTINCQVLQASAQLSASEVLRVFHQDEPYLFLGAAFTTVGLVTEGVLPAAASIRRRLLISLGIFADSVWAARMWFDTGLLDMTLAGER